MSGGPLMALLIEVAICSAVNDTCGMKTTGTLPVATPGDPDWVSAVLVVFSTIVLSPPTCTTPPLRAFGVKPSDAPEIAVAMALATVSAVSVACSEPPCSRY